MRNTKSGDMCVVYDVRFGFIVLEYYMDGYFENNSNYDNTEDLYQHLLDKWKFCWIVDKAKVNGTEEFEDYEPSLTKKQRAERDKALAHFEAAFRQIQTEEESVTTSERAISLNTDCLFWQEMDDLRRS